jgi:hypothetical protein
MLIKRLISFKKKFLNLYRQDEGESSMYIFDEHEEIDISQDNVVQTRAQVNKFKTKENVEKEKEKMRPNGAEETKQQSVANQARILHK